MPWTEEFPVFSDEHLERYLSCPDVERDRFHLLFSHQQLGNKIPGRNLIPISLSPGISASSKNCTINRGAELETLKNKLLGRILRAVCQLALRKEDFTVRIYLDPRWRDIAAPLLDGGCEVMLMDYPSEGPNPAKLWRYLAMEDGENCVAFIGIEEIAIAPSYMKAVDLLTNSKLGIWRYPLDRFEAYKPIDSHRFGCVKSYPALKLLCSYLWNLMQGGHDLAKKSKPLWSDENLEEFFLSEALYPRAAFDGVLTLVESSDTHSRWLILDVEYVTWANPASEVLFIESRPQVVSSTAHDEFIGGALFERLLHRNHPVVSSDVAAFQNSAAASGRDEASRIGLA